MKTAYYLTLERKQGINDMKKFKADFRLCGTVYVYAEDAKQARALFLKVIGSRVHPGTIDLGDAVIPPLSDQVWLAPALTAYGFEGCVRDAGTDQPVADGTSARVEIKNYSEARREHR
jgi:hypothetical protein